MALLGLGLSWGAHAQTVDGTRGGGEGYGTALATQTAATQFGDANNGNIFTNSSGSELDNIHAQVVGSDLYIFIGGNLEANGNTLDIFIDSKGGGQNPITAPNNGPASSYNGMTFDAGPSSPTFAPDYLLGLVYLGGNLQAQYSILGGAGSNNIGVATAGGTSFPIDFDLSVGTNIGELAINNSNTAGVTGAAVAGAAAVTKGIELRIPLSAIGTPLGDIRVTALINGGGRGFISNQVLAGLPSGTGNLGGTNNLTGFAGDQFVTIPYSPVVSQPDLGLSPTNLAFGSVLTTAGTVSKTFSLTNTGNAPLTVTGISSNNSAFTATPQIINNLAVGASQTITVAFDPSVAGSQSAILTVASDAPPASPNTVSVSGIGTLPGTAVVDGTRDATYPASLATQTVPTQFGDNGLGQIDAANGSELDNVTAQVIGSDLYVFIGGNLESNGNRIELLFDSKAGGENTIGATNPVPVSGLSGTVLDAGFKADYALSIQANGPTQTDFFFGEVGGNGGAVGTATSGGSSAALSIGAGSEGALDNSNTAGVSSSTITGAGNVATGLELRIPLSALAPTATHSIRLTAFVGNGGQNFTSNQFLAGLPVGTGNLGGTVNLTSLAGNQFVTVRPGTATDPEITIAPASKSFGNVASSLTPLTSTFTVSNITGADALIVNIASSDPAYTVSPSSFTVLGGNSQTVTVSFNRSVAGTFNGTLTITSNDPGALSSSFALSGKVIGPGNVVLDGTVDAGIYGPAKALQTAPTQFGDNFSELDGAYAVVQGSDLFVHITGNLESNGNKLLLFFDSDQSAGQQSYNGSNPQQPALNGNNGNSSSNLGGMGFDLGFKPERFIAVALNGSALAAGYVNMNGGGGAGSLLTPAGNGLLKPLNFGVGLGTGEIAIDNSNTGGVTGAVVGTPGAVTTGIELRIPLTALGAGITASTPLRVMALVTSQDYSFLSNQSLGGLPSNYGNLGGPSGSNFANFPGLQFFTARRGDVTVASPGTLLSGDFNTITVASGGELFPVEDRFDAATAVVVQNGGYLTVGEFGSRNLTGTGSFTLQDGGSLRIGNQAGISASGATGAVLLTGNRTFSNDANYFYQYSAGGTGSTGSGLPSLVRELEVRAGSAPTTLNLTAPVSVRRTVRVENTTTLNASAQTLTLLSNAANGTAMVINEGSGVVTGAVHAQCYVSGATNSALGYRHFASPVAAAPVSSIGSPMYGNFPAIYRYNEPAVTTDFGQGWTAATTGTMAVGKGYSILKATNAGANFVGTLNTGNVPVSLTNTAQIGGVNGSGWNFLGNPYPSPLDADALMASFPGNVNQAISTWKSLPSSPGAPANGQYIVRTPGAGSTDVNGGTSQYLPLAQGFFVRAASSATVTMTNAMRPSSYINSIHYRTAPEARPRLTLGLTASTGLQVTDNLVVVFDEHATAGFDNGFDGPKLRNEGVVPSLAALQNGEELAINVLGSLNNRTVVPLSLTVQAAGTYNLTASELVNLPAGTNVYLLDALTGTRQPLARATTYALTLPAGTQAQRFSLVFEPANSPLATAAELSTAAVTVYPNPSHGAFRVTLPVGLTASHAVVLDNLGRIVARPALTGATTEVELSSLPMGVYTLRFDTNAGAVTRRVVIE